MEPKWPQRSLGPIVAIFSPPRTESVSQSVRRCTQGSSQPKFHSRIHAGSRKKNKAFSTCFSLLDSSLRWCAFPTPKQTRPWMVWLNEMSRAADAVEISQLT
ncbi:Hypothetical predicted protein [Cloeon dipterum]|uniref:Uncharacterized protein n=1 Tax=Cloeon dipterum TaxID=197152 RepID=A0A8S1DPA8_9INSE|nr:Hypothetical predicted protein [Cloeon dipterum]